MIMIYNEPAFIKIAEALLTEYTGVYCVNMQTNEYRRYSADTSSHLPRLERSGGDFFADLKSAAECSVCYEDRYTFLRETRKENLLSLAENGGQRIEFRLMTDGEPVFHALCIIPCAAADDGCVVIGVRNIESEVEERRLAEQDRRMLEIYDQIAGGLAGHFDTLYYVDMETDEYFEYSSKESYKSLNIPSKGGDFFGECAKHIGIFVHPDDRERVLLSFKKENIRKKLENTKLFKVSHRLVIKGAVVHCRCVMIPASDKRHILVGVKNINEEIRAHEVLDETKKQSAAYSRIVSSLALRYDVIYYVNCETGDYSRYSSGLMPVDSSLKFTGKNFFSESDEIIDKQIYPEDKSRIRALTERDYIITTLDTTRQYSADFRSLASGGTEYVRITVMRAGDNVHFILGVENIDEEVKKEQEQIEALNRANELARRDVLTGARNRTAYHEFEESIQKSIDSGRGHSPFAIVICDINDLKAVNDNEGHKAGDEYIRSSCRIISGIFAHSPVFRIGGDEFAAVLAGIDYEKRISLVEMLRERSLENRRQKAGPVLAVGIAVYDRLNDKAASDVFKRADESMYRDKMTLKVGKPADAGEKSGEAKALIPAERRRLLDGMFEMNSISANGMYVYICDMKYDYSRWSKEAVDSYGLPSEYMYGAGEIWEEHIHEEDKEAYRVGMERIFEGNQSGHDMQYRARRINGEYTVCTCRGIVLKDENGEPEYFAGTIRDHGIQSNTDSLTGLRNQYGFFDNVQTNIVKNKKMRVSIVGIAKFSEINEIYGYHFGNLVLQKFGRFLFDHVGNLGRVYRLDGTKFAILSTELSIEEFFERYDNLRSYYREGVVIDGRNIMLELNAGLIDIDNFSIDPQTVMTCLVFAYNKSKIKRHGDMVFFSNDLGSGNRQRVEKFHSIRASITQGYAGFYLMYQPVVNAKTEKMTGAEALLRWRSEEYGTVPPDHFIPLLEQDPLFPSLGEWILTQAVTDAGKILESDPDFVINVNLSYSQIEKADFVDMVMDILDRTGYPAGNLCLEVTERCRLLDMDMLKNTVCSLRSRGVRVALDDFGTGFSSVGIVKSIPFDTIKIDRSLVRRIEDDRKERELIKTFVMMSNTCGAAVCVEGIETAGMGDILRQYDVHSFQGYYYSKPLEYDDLLKWRASREKV